MECRIFKIFSFDDERYKEVRLDEEVIAVKPIGRSNITIDTTTNNLPNKNFVAPNEPITASYDIDGAMGIINSSDTHLAFNGTLILDLNLKSDDTNNYLRSLGSFFTSGEKWCTFHHAKKQG